MQFDLGPDPGYIAAAMRPFIEPCLPSPADRPPTGSNWIHEIKHDGYRLMARRDPIGIRLITRRGNDWSERFPLVIEAVNHLRVRSCLIDGEVVCCDEPGLARFDVLRRRRNEVVAFLYAFEPIGARRHGSGAFFPAVALAKANYDTGELHARHR